MAGPVWLYAAGSLHALLCPYTKVEESFALQAQHDLLYHGRRLDQYDHHEFPGVVPRSFIGPMFISLLSAPLVGVFQMCGVNKLWSQYVVRLTLALCVICTWNRLRAALQKHFGNAFAWWFTVLTVTQYHFMFYMSRPLPNIMVMPLVLLSIEGWLQRKQTQFLLSSGAGIIIFRAELALLFGLFLLYDLLLGKLNVVKLLKFVVPAAIGLIAATVVIDSIFWGRLLWPEAEVFWFNTIMNKSSEWGTSPFFWYWYSALPRGLGPSLFLLPLGLFLDRRTVTFVLPALLYVLMFSFLPHKELRFIIYVFPLLNIGSAAACNYIYTRRKKAPIFEFLFWGMVLCILGNVALSTAFLSVATTNYPGGVALTRFHKLLKDEPFVHVHIDNLAAQTGVTRFLQTCNHWTYSKNESLQPHQLQQYTHLLIEAKSKYSPNLKPFSKTHTVLDSIEAFSHIAVSYRSMPPIKIKTKPAIFILERNDFREFPYGHSVDDGDDYEETESDIEEEMVEFKDPLYYGESNEFGDESINYDKGTKEQPENELQEQEIMDDVETVTELKEPDKQLDNEEITVAPQNVFDDIKALRRERKQKAIEKIKSETRKSVVESAKEKLKEIMDRHKHIADEIIKTDKLHRQIEEEIPEMAFELPVQARHEEEIDEKNYAAEVDIVETTKDHINEEIFGQTSDELGRNPNVEFIVEEVITRLIDRKIYDDKTKPEDITAEDRLIIQQIVEEVVAEKINIFKNNFAIQLRKIHK